MADQHDRRFTILSVLLVGLLVVVVIQSAVIMGLHKNAGREMRPASDATASRIESGHAQPRPATRAPIAANDQDTDPFAWELDEWDPFTEMQSMQDRINQMFGSAFNRFHRSDSFGNLFRDHPFAPDINIEDKGDRYLVTVDLPGTEDSQLDVKLEGQTLTIAGSVQSDSQETDQGGKMLRQERRSGKFRRMVTLPGPVKAVQMTTENRKGVVIITIPKAM